MNETENNKTEKDSQSPIHFKVAVHHVVEEVYHIIADTEEEARRRIYTEKLYPYCKNEVDFSIIRIEKC